MKAILGSLLLASLAFAGEETELKDDAGKTVIRYVVEAPANAAPTTDPTKQLGLILCFPEHDRPTGDEILPVREALKRQGLLDHYVLVGGHPQERKFGTADHEPLQKLIAWAKKTYPINPRRIYMYGKGEGGKISGQFTMLYPELVTAAVSYSWGWWLMPSETKEALDAENRAPEFYMVLGLRDLSHHLTTVRDTYSRVQAKGVHVIYREFEDLGARTYHPPSNDDAIAWITRLRNKTLPLSAEEQKMLQHPVVKDGYYPALAVVGGHAAGAVVRKLLESPDAEVRAAAAATCQRAVFGEATMAALGKKAADPSAKVRRLALRALAMHANWRSQAAQQALIDVALNPESDAETRVDAVDGLVYAVRYQVNGVRQDPQLFRALVTLLTDKNEELRVMASNVLAPIRDRGFRGDLGRPERKEPEGGWPQWLDAITAKNAAYRKDYEVCGSPDTEAKKLFCKGGESTKDAAAAFRYTLQSAEQGYVPAQAMVGMMYAVGKGVEQNVPEGLKWWMKAADGGHVLAANNASMAFRGAPGVKSDAETANRLTKFVAEHTK